jgi:lipopolysaccharide transport system permease protein
VHQGQLVFAQLMRHLPLTTFRRSVARYAGEHKVKSLSCLDQYLCMAFALTYRESLRDIEASLRAQSAKLYHLRIPGNVARNTHANANVTRDWRISASFAEQLIGIARDLCAEDISDSKMLLDLPRPDPGAYYLMDRSYLDFERLYRLHDVGSYFVTRARLTLGRHCIGIYCRFAGATMASSQNAVFGRAWMGNGLASESAARFDQKSLVIIDSRGGIGSTVSELFSRRELLSFLIWRDIKVRYKQTVFGVLWAVLLPLLQTFIFAVIFGRFAHIEPDGNYSYTVFVLAGLIPWTFFSQALTFGGQSLVNQQHLLTKVYFPRLFVPAAAVGGCFIDFLVGLVLYAVILVLSGIVPGLGILLLPALVALMIIASLGIVFLLAALTVSYRDFKYITPFGVQLLMYLSPIVYPTNIVPEKYRWIFALNPMAGIVDGWRSAILGKPWDTDLILISTASALILFAVGIGYFRHTERRFADIA